MLNGTISFNCRVVGLAFDSFDHAPKPPSIISKASIVCDLTTGMDFTATITNAPDMVSARQAAMDEVVRLADRIAYHLAPLDKSIIGLGIPVMTGHSFPGMLGHSTNAFISGFRKLAVPELQKMATWLNEAAPPGEDYLPAFHAALVSLDPAARFMSLYHLLMILGNDDQWEVDKFVKKVEGKRNFANTRPVRDKPNVFKEESRYSRLRNEFAHHRQSKTVLTTRAEMEACLYDLVMVASAAVEKMRPSPPKHRKIRLNLIQKVRKWLRI